MKLTLMRDELYMVKLWVDASYEIHDDCKCHTGAVVTLGKGAVTIFSINQKIQGNSYTEDKPIESDNAVPQALWSIYFLEA